jgi:pheromone a factor receptor
VHPLPLSILILTLTYIVRGHCYNIFEIIGCLGETYGTPVYLPPILIGAVSAV